MAPASTPTPLPRSQLAIVLLVQVCGALNTFSLFPFLPFLVEGLGYTGPQLGPHVGLLGAAYSGSQFCSSLLWGYIGDTYGRKPAIICGSFGSALGMIMFGTSTTFNQAILGRVVGGFLSGNLGIIKAFLSESTDHTNRSKGFSYLSMSMAFGTTTARIHVIQL